MKAIKLVIVIAMVAYAALAVAILLWADHSTRTWKDFATTAGVGITLLTTLFSACMSTITAYKQASSAQQLERVKDDISAKRKASDGLLAAAYEYYYLLKLLEREEWSEDLVRTAETKMATAAALQTEFSEATKQKWENFWSAARFIVERVVRGDNKKTVWLEQSAAASTSLKELKDVLAKERTA